MITKSDIEVSNQSYSNLDFAKVYEEILDIAKKLSANYDPTASNESDPGVVLLKVLAMAVDKLSYNTDKAQLENKLPSATQKSSLIDLCEQNGYSPKYYTAAKTQISASYLGEITDSKTFTLPAYKTEITDPESSIIYTLIEPITLSIKNQEVTREAIQGKITDLISSATNTNVIQLIDLDDNNRIYFPEEQVAQNGVFINNESNKTVLWEAKDNLNIVEPGTLAYRFGYDSKEGLPYIEFPKDIAALIGSGLEIRYAVTDGAAGNVKAKFLTKRADSSDITFDDTDEKVQLVDEDGNELLSISNPSASINGANPETIDEAYNSFKSVVGTFDTLVACRDYANAIYNLYSSDDTPIVSNIQVADRRSDINYANNIITFNEYGITKKNNILKTNGVDNITPFDLCLYPLKPIKFTHDITTYENSFKPLEFLEDITSGIEEYKTASHTYKKLADGDIYAYKNYYKLTAKITTTYKVNVFEQLEIQTHVYEALFEKFNARQLEYGYEIPFETLLDVITKADSRIKNVSLSEPELSTKVLLANGSEAELVDGTSTDTAAQYINLLAKNIVAGKLSLFEYDKNFEFEFGQSKSPNTGRFTLTIQNHQLEGCEGVTVSYTNSYSQTATFTITAIPDEDHIILTRIVGGGTIDFEPTGTISVTIDEEEDPVTKEYSAVYLVGQIIGRGTTTTSDGKKHHLGIKSITTNVDFETDAENPGRLGTRTMLENQALQLIAPNLATEVSYPYGVNYAWLPDTNNIRDIPADTEFRLSGLDKFIIEFTDSKTNKSVVRIYSSHDITDGSGTVIKSSVDVNSDGGNILRSNFKITPTESRESLPTKRLPNNTKLYTLSTNDEIAVRKFVRASITDADFKCYWLTNRPNNALFTDDDAVYAVAHKYVPGKTYYTKVDGEYIEQTDVTEEQFYSGTVYYSKAFEVILAEGEYFIYTNNSNEVVPSVGSGTKLTLFADSIIEDAWKIAEDEGPSLEEINNSGTGAFKDYPWIHKNFSNQMFEIQEMQVLTLTAGDTISGVVLDTETEADVSAINNTFKKVSNTSVITYTLFGQGTTEELPTFSVDSCFWQIRSRLDLAAGPASGQQLKVNETIIFDVITDITASTVGGKVTYTYTTMPVELKQQAATYLSFNTLVQQVGGKNIEMSTIDTSGTVGYELEAYIYDYEQPTYKIVSNGQVVAVPLERAQQGYISISFNNYAEDTASTHTTLKVNRLTDEDQLILFYYKNENGVNATIKLTANAGGGVHRYRYGETDTNVTLVGGVNIIEVAAGTSEIYVNIQFIDDTKAKLEGLTIGKLSNIIGINPALFPAHTFGADSSAFVTALQAKIAQYGSVTEDSVTKNIFYYNCDLDNVSVIETTDMTDPLALFDSNNIANKFTISEIDFSAGNINIDITKSSKA